MVKFLKARLGTLVALILIAACTRSRGLPVEVESLKQHLPAIVEAAKSWRSDAYLESASVRLIDESYTSYLIWADFASPSEESESVAVKLLTDGSIDVETFDQVIPGARIEPITDDDWELDSQEAVSIALDDDGRRFLEEQAGEQCSLAILERMNSAAGAPVVWRLVLSECANPLSGQSTIIDATTGKLMSRELHLPTAVP